MSLCFQGGIRLKEGKIIRLTGGLYTVVDNQGTCADLRAAGLFRHHNESPKVGDDVTYDDDLIRTIRPRRNNLLRPAIANVDQALLVNACKEPDFSFLLLDQFILLILSASVKPVIKVVVAAIPAVASALTDARTVQASSAMETALHKLLTTISTDAPLLSISVLIMVSISFASSCALS